MAICVISPVGLSVFLNASKPLGDAGKTFALSEGQKLEDIVSGKGEFPGYKLYRAIVDELLAYTKSSPDDLGKASGELNALVRILNEHPANNNDHLYFLATNTPSGALAARILSDFVVEHFLRDSEVRIIDGLQVQKADQLREIGVPNLITTIFDILEDHPSGTFHRVLNATGGFKNIMPYLTLIGMLQHLDVAYIFEGSEELITLAGLPVRLDVELLEEYFDALDKVATNKLDKEQLSKQLKLKDQPLSEHAIYNLLDLKQEANSAEAGIEQVRSVYQLNGLGQIVYRQLKRSRARTPVWLSIEAQERFEKDAPKGSVARGNFEEILNRLQYEDNRVMPYRHEYKGSDAPAYKYKGKERLFYWELPDKILVLELAFHKSGNDSSYDKVAGKPMKYSAAVQWVPTDNP